MPVNSNSSSTDNIKERSFVETNENLENNFADESNNTSSVTGLSEAEKQDPNKIIVTIPIKKVPLVVLFGPPACGKTMTLVRLTRYLQSEGYIISPIREFRPSSDKNYDEICDNFDTMINSANAAASTNRVSFMLVDVLNKNGRSLCQILEAPGEHYFNPEKPRNGFPSYVNTIIQSSNRKIWTIMLQPKWKDEEDRRNYVTRIAELKTRMRSQDHVVFIYNKIDLTPFVINIGNVNCAATLEKAKEQYPNMFTPFENMNPITKYIYKYRCEFVPFQTGTYTDTEDGGVTYQEGPREYCAKLWNVLLKKIRG